jgi:hypothetical protein
VLGTHAEFYEFVADVHGVRHIDREANRFSLLAEAMPMSDDVADQFGAIHASAS